MEPISIFMLIVSAIAGIASSAISAGSTEAANQRNIDLARENREDQQQFSMEAQRQSEQSFLQNHSLAAQYQQLKDAGLNASMIYGQGGGGTSSSQMAATPASQIPTIMPTYGGGNFEQILKALSTPSNIKRTESETALNEQQADNLKAQIPAIEQSIEESRARVDNILADTGLKKEQIESEDLRQLQQSYLNQQERMNMEWAEATYEDRVKMITQQVNNLEAQEKEIYERIKGLEIDNKYKPGLYNAQIAELNAQAAKLYAERGLVLEQQALTQAETRRTNADNVRLQNESKRLQQDIVVKDYEQRNYWSTKVSNGTGILGGTIATLWNWCNALATGH